MKWTLIIAYYEGKTGDSKALLVTTDCDLGELTPEHVGLTSDDSFNSIQVMYDDCQTIAVANGPDCSVLICDVTQEGRDGAEAAGYEIIEKQEWIS